MESSHYYTLMLTWFCFLGREPEHFYLLLQFLWRELCEGMTAAKSLDEVIEVHEAYILSIQRQCFVVPDKLVIYHIS